MMSKKVLLSAAVFVLVLGLAYYFSAQSRSGALSGLASLFSSADEPGQLDQFAQCLKDKGAIFYGAFWCPHCQNQKKMFGSSEKLLNYIECSTPDGRGQFQVCKDKEIKGYPTWIFADGSRESGEVPLSELAQKTGCELPKSR